MNLIDKINFILARSAFAKQREAFYRDLAEAIFDKESINVFLSRAEDHCTKYKRRGQALIYATMNARFSDKEGRISHMLETIVPNSDMLAITAIDEVQGNAERSEGFRQLAAQIKRSGSMKAGLWKSVASSLLLLPTVIAFAILNTKQIPAYERTVPDRDRWPFIGQMLGTASDIVTDYGLEIIVGVVIFAVLFRLSFSRWRGGVRSIFDRYVPYSLYRDTQGSNFLMNMASLLRAGKQLVESLELLATKTSPWLKWHLSKMSSSLSEHPDDYDLAFDTGLFSPDLHLRLSSYGSRSKNFAEAFIRLGTDGLEHVQENFAKTCRRLTVISIAINLSALVFFYVGNAYLSDALADIEKAELNSKLGR